MNDIGYTVDFEVLNSKYFGVPQNRERIFIVAIRDDLIEPQAWEIGKRTDVVAKGKRRIAQLNGVKTFNFDYPEQTEVATRLRDILEKDVDERFYLSEEKTAKLVVQLEERSESVIIQRSRGKNNEGTHDIAPTVTVYSYEDINHVAEPQMLGHLDLKGHDAIKRVYSAEGVSPTLTTMGGGHREPKIAEVQSVGNVNPSGNGMNGQVYDLEAGLSPTLTTNKGEGVKIVVSEHKELCPKCMVIEHIGLGCACDTEAEVRPVLTPDRVDKRQNGRRFKDDDEESFTLTAQDKHGVAIGTKTEGHPRYRIRKLTPLECFRLQGFPDSAHQALVDAGISNSQRYKMAGNAVTVNVIDAIGVRLLPFICD